MPEPADRPPPSRRDFEVDALRQRKFATPVDGVGLATHVRLPGIRAGFATTAGVFFAAECSADFGTRGANVHVRDSAIAAGGCEETFGVLHVVREDR